MTQSHEGPDNIPQTLGIILERETLAVVKNSVLNDFMGIKTPES